MKWEKLFVFLVVWIHSNAVTTTENCIYSIDFQEMNDIRTVTALENTEVIVQFCLKSNCSFSDKVVVFKDEPKGIEGADCSIWPGEDNYVSRGSSCSHVKNGMYEFRRTVHMRDSGFWIWQINSEPPYKTKVFLNITASESRSTKQPPSSTVNPKTAETRNPSYSTQHTQATLVVDISKAANGIEVTTSKQNSGHDGTEKISVQSVAVPAVGAAVAVVVVVCATVIVVCTVRIRKTGRHARYFGNTQEERRFKRENVSHFQNGLEHHDHSNEHNNDDVVMIDNVVYQGAAGVQREPLPEGNGYEDIDGDDEVVMINNKGGKPVPKRPPLPDNLYEYVSGAQCPGQVAASNSGRVHDHIPTSAAAVCDDFYDILKR